MPSLANLTNWDVSNITKASTMVQLAEERELEDTRGLRDHVLHRLMNYGLNNLSELVNQLDYSQMFEESSCTGWSPLSHLYLQLGNVLLLLAHLMPYGRRWSPLSRTLFGCGGCLHLAWSWLVLCSFDLAMWSLIFITVNLGRVLLSVTELFPVHLEKRMDSVYSNIFKPLKVSKEQFKTLLSGMRTVRSLQPKEKIIEEKTSRVDSLSLVLSGRLMVTQAGRQLHAVHKFQFLDSPEWFGVTTDDYFQVSITAEEDSEVLVWHRDRLKFLLMEDTFLQAVMDHVIGRDVVKKLLQVQEEGKDKTGLCLNTIKEGDSDNILSSGLVKNPASWRLGKITENEHESLV